MVEQATKVPQGIVYGGFSGRFQQQTQRLQRLQTLVQSLVALPMSQLEEGYFYTDTTFIDKKGTWGSCSKMDDKEEHQRCHW